MIIFINDDNDNDNNVCKKAAKPLLYCSRWPKYCRHTDSKRKQLAGIKMFTDLITNMACFTREGTSTIAVYGKHIFQNNFSLAIMLEMFCCLN